MVVEATVVLPGTKTKKDKSLNVSIRTGKRFGPVWYSGEHGPAWVSEEIIHSMNHFMQHVFVTSLKHKFVVLLLFIPPFLSLSKYRLTSWMLVLMVGPLGTLPGVMLGSFSGSMF